MEIRIQYRRSQADPGLVKSFLDLVIAYIVCSNLPGDYSIVTGCDNDSFSISREISKKRLNLLRHCRRLTMSETI